MPLSNKRAQLVEAADELTHRQGFYRTTLAEIADAAQVLPGNVYYYFKTKDALGEALIERRVDHNAALRQAWDAHPDPKERLYRFLQMPIDNRRQLAEHGCPIGSLCQELQKHGAGLGETASRLFADLLDWLQSQFDALGQGAESADLAVHVLSAIEGATLLAHTFRDPKYVVREAERLKAWVRAL